MTQSLKFTDRFLAARQVSTPLISVRTPDSASTIAGVRKALVRGMNKTQAEETIAKIPFIEWDAIRGLNGYNNAGASELANILAVQDIQKDATCNLPIALQLAVRAKEDVILFLHNAHLFWTDPLVIQGIWNLRDPYKANGNMLILLTSLGTILPPELNNDMLLLEEPLPTRDEIKKIVLDTFKFANCAAPKPEVLTSAADALIGIAAFPCDQEVAMSLDKATGELDIAALWNRKREIISATNGVSFYTGVETLTDAGGLDNIKKYLSAIMRGKRSPKIILRLDEIEKAFAGAGTDSSGVKGDLLGNFLSWIQDKSIFCVLFVGIPGASKSHIIYCLGGEFKVPVLNFDVAGMQDSLVGNSGKNLRAAEATVEAISDGQILLCATANSLTGLPPELLSRFQKGGIFFFDNPTPEERAAILDLKVKKYCLAAEQMRELPDMTGWTGREIDAVCDKADMLGISVIEASQYVVPITKSHSEQMVALRQSAHNRYLSASKIGLYTYSMPKTETVHTPNVEVVGRKIR